MNIRWLVFGIFPLIAANCAFALIFNEVMYNPAGDDNNKEFIEIYNENYTNLSSFIIADAASNDTLKEIKYFDSGYLLITEEGFNHSMVNASVYSAGATIGNNLGNNGDNLTLFYPNGTSADFIAYLSSQGADGNGYTLERINPNEAAWGISLIKNGTPGLQNSIYGTGEIDYTKIKITEFIPDPRGNDSAPMPDGEWIELHSNLNFPAELKWMFFKDSANHKLYVIDTTVRESTVIPANGYLVVYTNGYSGFLNNDEAETLYFYDKEGNMLQNITYFGSKEGNSYAYLEGFGWQNTMPTPFEQNVYSSEHNESYVRIEDIYDLGSDKKAQFGQTIRVKVDIYKGDTTKTAVSLWAENGEKISKDTKVNIYTKYTDYILTLPVQIKPNCNNEFDDGKYYVHIEGFGYNDKKEIQVEGNLKGVCDMTMVKLAESNQKFEYSLLSYPLTVYPGKEFTVNVEVKSDDKEHELEIWSYVYKGSISYSGEKEMNKQMISISEGSSAVIDIKNTVVDAKPGDYKLKVKIKKDNQKTLKELTADIKVDEYPSEDILAEEKIPSARPLFNYGKPFAISTIIFESSQRKSEKLAPYGIAFVMLAAVVFMLIPGRTG